MLIIIKDILDSDYNFFELNKYSEILLIDNGIYNLLYSDFTKLNTKINVLNNDLLARGLELPKELTRIINLINYKDFANLTIKNKFVVD